MIAMGALTDLWKSERGLVCIAAMACVTSQGPDQEHGNIEGLRPHRSREETRLVRGVYSNAW